MGCHIPRIPGYYATETNGLYATPVSTEYSCIGTPSSLSMRRSSLASYANTIGTITRSNSFPAMAVATRIGTSTNLPKTFINYGCWTGTPKGSIGTGITGVGSLVAWPNITIQECIQRCSAYKMNFMAVGGIHTNTSCTCGDSVNNPSVGPVAIDQCNEPCNYTQGIMGGVNCGNDNRVLIYALDANATSGPWYSSWAANIITRTVCYPQPLWSARFLFLGILSRVANWHAACSMVVLQVSLHMGSCWAVCARPLVARGVY